MSFFFFCAARLRLLFMRSVRRLPYDQVKIPVVSAKAQPRKHKVILPIAMVRQCHVTTFRYRRNIFSHFFQHVKPEKDVRIESGNIVFRAIGFRISYCVFSVQEVDGRWSSSATPWRLTAKSAQHSELGTESTLSLTFFIIFHFLRNQCSLITSPSGYSFFSFGTFRAFRNVFPTYVFGIKGLSNYRERALIVLFHVILLIVVWREWLGYQVLIFLTDLFFRFLDCTSIASRERKKKRKKRKRGKK